jgi:hypothetical protein
MRRTPHGATGALDLRSIQSSKEVQMPKVSKATAKKEEFGPVTDLNDEVDGYRIGFATFHEDIDGTPLMKGLPGDMCQCPHWGYVLRGRIVFRDADHDETYEAGDAFYTPPGHIPVKHEPDSEVLMFSPADELAKTEAAIERNFAALRPA